MPVWLLLEGTGIAEKPERERHWQDTGKEEEYKRNGKQIQKKWFCDFFFFDIPHFQSEGWQDFGQRPSIRLWRSKFTSEIRHCFALVCVLAHFGICNAGAKTSVLPARGLHGPYGPRMRLSKSLRRPHERRGLNCIWCWASLAKGQWSMMFIYMWNHPQSPWETAWCAALEPRCMRLFQATSSWHSPFWGTKMSFVLNGELGSAANEANGKVPTDFRRQIEPKFVTVMSHLPGN